MKVAFVTRFPADPSAPRGGVESVSVVLVRALSALGDLELHVVTTDSNCRRPEISTWEGVTVHRLPRRGWSTLTEAVGVGRRQMRAYLTQLSPDLVHAHDVYGLMVKGLALPRVFTIHGFIYGDTLLSRRKLPPLRALIWKWVETSGWADQPHLVSISPYVRERLGGIARGVIHDIDNPVNDDFFQIERHERRGTIFSAAWIIPRKNTLGLLAGFARLSAMGVKAELRLAGSQSDSDYSRRVREYIRDHDLEGRVKLLGRIDAQAVQQELSQASVFALASLEENSPMGVEEAMAAGVPVVTSNRCGMPYLLRDGESGFLIDPHDPDDIAQRLKELLEDDARRAAMGETSRKIAGDRFQSAVVARRTREVYLRAIHTFGNKNGHGQRRR